MRALLALCIAISVEAWLLIPVLGQLHEARAFADETLVWFGYGVSVLIATEGAIATVLVLRARRARGR